MKQCAATRLCRLLDCAERWSSLASSGLPDDVNCEICAVVDAIELEIARIKSECCESCPNAEFCRCLKPLDQVIAAKAA
jgi:hypothetical protein